MKKYPSCCLLTSLLLTGCSTSNSHLSNTASESQNIQKTPVQESKLTVPSSESSQNPLKNEEKSDSHNCSINQHNCSWNREVFWEDPFILSSLHTIALPNKKSAILFENPKGDIHRILLDENGFPQDEKIIASFSQISCTEPYKDGFRIGIISRDPAKASYSFEIMKFDATGEPVPENNWKAVKHNFTPDPGAGCAFDGEETVYVVGTRPRGDRPPFHGLYRLQKDAADLVEDTRNNVPDIISSWNSQGQTKILLRVLRTNEETQTNRWPHQICALPEEGAPECIQEADWLLPTDNSPIIQNNGCITTDDMGTHCIEPQTELTLVRSMTGACNESGNELCMQWQSQEGTFLVKVKSDAIESVSIPQNTFFWNLSHPIKKEYHLSADVDELYPDTAHHLGFTQIESDCLFKPLCQ